MLEVTADDIAALDDDDLRTVVGRLCEAELRARGLPTSAITWGGHQDAADGGIDVRVDLPAETEMAGFIPRAATGFQVKKPDMPPNEINREMRPKGTLRPSIQSLADRKGAYIIVCSSASVSDTALADRRNAMASAVDGAPSERSLALDFYDRTRVATWVREHPGLIPWVRRKAGRQIAGWQSYGPWANPGEAPDAEFIADNASRFRTGSHDDGAGLAAIVGLNRIRKALATPGNAVRLVGLSGVGKTRLVQALFDPRVGEDSLDPALAFYTDTSDGPEPVPVGMVSDLVLAKSRAIVVVDNCPSDLHRRLAEVCKGSTVSVITTEYDIREDQPESTEVFSLEPCSVEMIEKVLGGRFRDLSPIDARRIADVSGGNFRVALALAGTVERGDSVSGLTDAQLFERLFHQRHDPDLALLQAAKACSLLYSFEGEAVTADSELARLGRLVGQDPVQLYVRVVELRRRELVQARSIWRAVLPHAVANRLAALALQDVPPKIIDLELVTDAPERVKRSFSRRLGFLHDNEQARCIAEKWLKPGELLSSLATLDDLHADMLANIAPVAPEAVLAALEREASGPSKSLLVEKQRKFVPLLRSLAYDPALFERCAELLADFAVEGGDRGEIESADVLESLFFPYLSGTHATIDQRIRVVEGLVTSSDSKRKVIGLKALRALLETSHFSSAHNFEFGSRSRDFGYYPTFPEVRIWYTTVLKAIEGFIFSSPAIAADVASVLGSAFRGLWTDAWMHDDLERVSRAITRTGYWREGWIAVRQTLTYDKSRLRSEARARLAALEKELRPADLIQKIRSIVLSSRAGGIDLDDYEEDDESPDAAWDRAETLAEQLGAELVHDKAAFEFLLPEIVSGSGRLFRLGSGLGSGASKPARHWQLLREALAAQPEESRSILALKGFLHGLNAQQPDITASLLDAAVDDAILAPYFPELQCAVPVGSRGVERLRRSLDLGFVPIDRYAVLAWGRCHETVNAPDLRNVVIEISKKPNGIDPAIEILFFRLFGNKQDNRPNELGLIKLGRELLSIVEFKASNGRNDHNLDLVVRICLSGAHGKSSAQIACARFKAAVMKEPNIVRYYYDFFESLCETQPVVVLDTFFMGTIDEQRAVSRMLRWFGGQRKDPLDSISDEVLIEWCNRDPDARYPAMATVMPFLKGSESGEEGSSSHWASKAWKLIEFAPDPVVVVRKLVERFHPSGWSGSLASILEGRMALLNELSGHKDPKIAAFVVEAATRLAEQVDEAREWEAGLYRDLDERFE